MRWTGQLQRLLGDSHYVIEEGLGGRTTNLEDPNPEKQGRNGLAYFGPCMESHLPLDWVVIMLGTNDFKIQYKRSASETVEALREYVHVVRQKSQKKFGRIPKVLLVSPISMSLDRPLFEQYFAQYYDANTVSRLREISGLLKLLCDSEGCFFLDAVKHAEPGDDGVHIDKESLGALAQAISNTIIM